MRLAMPTKISNARSLYVSRAGCGAAFSGALMAVPSGELPSYHRAMAAEITYTADSGEKLVNETFGPNNIRRRSSGTEERRQVDVQDGRPLLNEFGLDISGFTLVEHRTAVQDFFDAGELERVYYPEVEALIRRVA